MGSNGNPLATFRFTETSNIENVKITDLKVFDSVTATTSVKAAFSNLTLWKGSTQLGTAGSAVDGGIATTTVGMAPRGCIRSTSRLRSLFRRRTRYR